MFIAALFIIAKIWEQPWCPLIDEWIKKSGVCIYKGILLSHIKEWNFALCKNMNGLGGHYGKWTKSDRERQMLYITYMWTLKNIRN